MYLAVLNNIHMKLYFLSNELAALLHDQRQRCYQCSNRAMLVYVVDACLSTEAARLLSSYFRHAAKEGLKKILKGVF